jgi:hypothetical protein
MGEFFCTSSLAATEPENLVCDFDKADESDVGGAHSTGGFSDTLGVVGDRVLVGDRVSCFPIAWDTE